MSTTRILFLAALGFVFALTSATSADKTNLEHLNGFVESGYRYRSDGDNTDQDATQALSLDYCRPWARFGEGAEAGFVFYGLLQEDLDDRPQGDEFDHFRDVGDSYEDSFAYWLYLAYGELTTYGPVKTFRLGRQELLELEPLHFDGGFLTLRAAKRLSLSAFGGIPVNLFEESENRQGDSVAGAYLNWGLLRNLSIILGYINLRDEIELLDGTDTTLEENLTIAQASWRITRTANLLSRATLLDDEVRDASIRGSYNNDEKDIRISTYYYHQFITREAETLTEDPFSILLGDYKPYHQGNLNLYKGLGELFGIEAGFYFRELLDPDDETLYNHTYERYLLNFYILKMPFDGSEWILGADLWSAPGDAYNESYRGEFNQKFGKRGKFHIGSAYYLFKIDDITGEEREEVQTYYAGFTAPLTDKTTLKMDYAFEDGDSREVDTFRAWLKYDF